MDCIFLLQHLLQPDEVAYGEGFEDFALLAIEGYLLFVEVFLDDHEEGILAELVQSERIRVVISVYDLYH